MSSPPPERASRHQDSQSKIARYTAPFLAAIALIYAPLAGLHTLQDFDLGWQLATGRWILQHHHIFSTDVFSYTAQGAPWIYPVLSGIAFYVAYLAGGYALLSWLGAAACAATTALLLSRNNVATSALALIAVPLIANRTQPRAEMFTTLMFAAFLTLLWKHHRTGRSPLWLLPILMVAWVNLHLGFVAGLALCAAYVFSELDLPSPETRAAARTRLQRAWPWLALTAVATLINPWGANIYIALSRQAKAQKLHGLWVVEWESIRPTWTSLRQALAWRDPQSCFWWLLAIAVVCATIALWRRQWGSAILLVTSACLTIQHVRLQALFACVVVVLGGSLLQEVWRNGKAPSKTKSYSIRDVSKQQHSFEWAATALLLLTALLTATAGLRSRDLITNRYYLRSTQLSLFGTGLSWWFPERAVEFLRLEKLPANLFNTYNLGGYLTWRLSPDYLDYIDSRAIPFGPQLFFRAYDLSTQPPGAPAWQQEADARNINTIFVSLARSEGITLFPQLPAFCHSQAWRPVYMDEVSAIFVRRTPQAASLIDRLQIDCDKLSFAPRDLSAAKTSRDQADLFNRLANAAGILYSLGRYSESLVYLDAAENIFSGSANLHLTRARVLDRMGRAAEAEEEFRSSIRIEPRDESWLDLGLFYLTQKRYPDAAKVFRRSAESSSRPHDLWMLLGQAYLQMNQPEQALEAFDRAEASSPFRGGGESLGTNFSSLMATGRAKAWYQLGDVARAVSFQEQAVTFAPNDAKLWLGLADLYEAQGRVAQAEKARRRSAGRE